MALDPKPELNTICSAAKAILAKCGRLSRRSFVSDDEAVRLRGLAAQLSSLREQLAAIHTPRRHEGLWQDAVRMHREGRSVSEIARLNGRSRRCIQHILRKSGIGPLPSGGKRPRSFPVQHAVLTYKAGVSLADLSEHYGISTKTLKRCIISLGGHIRSRGDSTVIVDGNGSLADMRDRSIDIGDHELASKIQKLIDRARTSNA